MDVSPTILRTLPTRLHSVSYLYPHYTRIRTRLRTTTQPVAWSTQPFSIQLLASTYEPFPRRLTTLRPSTNSSITNKGAHTH